MPVVWLAAAMTDLLLKREAEFHGRHNEYRPILRRTWGAGPRLIVTGLNPSVADHQIDDQTITILMGRGHRMGCGGLVMLNAFDFRATDPLVMKAAAEPNSPANDAAIRRVIRDEAQIGDTVIAAWGHHATYRNREEELLRLLCDELNTPLYALGLTKDGHPRHPLRIPYSQLPFLWINGRIGYAERQKTRVAA